MNYKILEVSQKINESETLATMLSSEQVLFLKGENWVHSHGFYTCLCEVAQGLGDEEFELVDVESINRRIRLSTKDTESCYFRAISKAPLTEDGISFPQAVRLLAFIGRGNWIVISDRDKESIIAIVIGHVSSLNMTSLYKLVYNDSQDVKD